uniref:Ycf34 n=1 Tax=Melanthalia intermedia TaxID=172989 RepID=A0A345UAM2_9FLOR|nr:hypothetical protein [Melanthalia intermedia]AXI97508.1 hypothetical protein [Melanthalia intermedia]
MCICVNCKHVHECLTYRFIQQRHKQKEAIIVNLNPNIFIPKEVLINININCAQNIKVISFEWDLQECLSFVELPGCWINSI